MCKKLIFLMSFVLVLGMAGNAGADAPPAPWISADIGTPTAGNADYNPGTGSIDITGNGNDIWGTADNFHYVYREWTGDIEIIGRVAVFPDGADCWQKAGAMVRDDLTPGSKHILMAISGTCGNGASFQGRDTADSDCWYEPETTVVTEPEWFRLVRTGDLFSGYRSEDGVTWIQVGTNHTTTMTGTVYVGLAVTSHSAGNLVTATIDNFGGDVGFSTSLPSNPNPPHLAVDVPVDANISWTRGDYCLQDEVYFGTDPCALPSVATIQALPPFPPMWNPPGDLVASTTYYWQVVDSDSNTAHAGPVWSFSTIPGEAQPDYPFDGAVITGDTVTYLGDDYIWTKLTFIPGATAAGHVGYFNEDYSKVASRHPDAFYGAPPYAGISGWEYTLFAGNPQVPPATDTLVRGTKYYWTADANDALDNWFFGDIWAFAIQGFYAFEPSPPNEAIFIDTTPYLSWLPGFGVSDHDIYMGTSWEDVNDARYDFYVPPPEFVTTRSDPNYQVKDINTLPYNTKVYWRVDQVNGRMPPPMGGGEYFYGDVWEFTTLPEGVGRIREDLWWNIPGVTIAELYAHPNFPGSPSETRMLNSFDSGMDIGDNYGGMIHGWLHPAYSGDYKFWITTDDYSELYLSTDETPGNRQLIASQPNFWVNDYMWYDNALQESAPIPLVAGQKYYIRACWKEGGGGDQCQVAWQGPDQPLAPVANSASAVIPGSRLSPFVQLWAHDPDPRDWQHAVPVSTTLKWGPGDHAALHDVYLGKVKDVVEIATTITPGGIYKGRIGPNSLSVLLDAAEFYYWRVDEVNLAGPDPCLWKGATWTLRTVGAAGGLLGLYYHWDGILPPGLPGGPPDPGPANPFQVFVMSRIEPTIDFWRSDHYWSTSALSPDPNVNVDNFACRWVGHVEAPVDANYTFLTQTDDGARLFINGVQILPIAAWQQQGMTWWSGEIVLTPGLHDIEMQMEEGGGGAGARLAWSAIPTNPSDDPIPQQIIPPIWLWPPLFASGPRPPDGSTIDDRTPALEWIPGVSADYHELYFSTNFDDVNNRTPGIKQILSDPCRPYPAVPRLELGETYYWLVDEVKSIPAGRWNARTVWSFTISECLSLDNMEDYNDRGELRRVWRDGNANVVWTGTYPYLTLYQGGSSGSNLNVSTAVGSPTGAGPIPPTPLNYEAMVLYYDNDGWTYQALPGEEKWVYDAPYYSEIEANTVGNNSLDVGQTWDSEGVKSLSVSFQGHPVSDGYYEAPLWPAYTVYGRGRDIQGRHDEFYFLSQYPFIGAGSIQARVLSVDNTHPWAKAGVMIREKRTPYSKYAAVFITPGQGVTFQYRDVEDGPTTTITKPGVSAPQYVRLVRNISGAFEAKHSDNIFVWQDVNAPDTEPMLPEIAMGTIDDPNIYVGSAVTSLNANQICAADFNDLLISPLPPNWIFGNIGTNDPEQLYVALSDGTNTSVIEHNDPNAATLTTWQEWNIALTEFTTVNLDGITKVYIGLGDRAAPVYGGSGAIYVDDIRACPPRCIPALAKPLYDIAQPYDCIVNERDLALVGVDWLLRDELIITQIPSPGPIAQYLFEGNFLDSVGSNHGDPCESPAIVLDAGRGSNVVDLNGSNQWVSTDANAVDLGIDGNTPKTITAWAYTRSFNNGGIFDMGAYVAGQNFCLRTQTTDNDWRTQLWGGAYDIDFNYDSLDKWVHFALVDEGSQTTVYADGGIVAQAARNLATAGNVPFRIGQYNVADNFDGRIDDVRIYNYGLSQEEVAYIASNSAVSLHLPIQSIADVYQGEAPGNQWINFKDYALIADKYLEEVLWPAP